MNYTCKECGGSVNIDAGVIKRNCGHDTSGVLANCSATVYGEGGARQLSILEKLFRTIKTNLGLK